MTFDGVFEDSSILFTSGELSEKLPFEGYLYGEGRILGSVWSPELDLKLNSDQLMIKETIFSDVQAKLQSSRTEEGLGGEMSISFMKEDGCTLLGNRIRRTFLSARATEQYLKSSNGPNREYHSSWHFSISVETLSI